MTGKVLIGTLTGALAVAIAIAGYLWYENGQLNDRIAGATSPAILALNAHIDEAERELERLLEGPRSGGQWTTEEILEMADSAQASFIVFADEVRTLAALDDQHRSEWGNVHGGAVEAMTLLQGVEDSTAKTDALTAESQIVLPALFDFARATDAALSSGREEAKIEAAVEAAKIVRMQPRP